jgi:hypothetical protein
MSQERTLEIAPAATRGTLLTAFLPALAAAGAPCSEARLAATFGHAFTFSMNRNGGELWQLANIEWCFFFRDLELLPFRFESFDAVLKGARPAPTPSELQALKERTWEAVVRGIDRGVPSIAWGAMTLEQREAGIPGFEWNLIVGYDAGDRSYRIRHLPHEPSWSVPYDRFGYTDPVQWYHVMTPSEPRSVDFGFLLRRVLQQASDYASGKRFDPANGCYPVGAIGFGAFELWKGAILRGDSPRFAPGHADYLAWSRERAGEFLRDLANAAGPAVLAKAADSYFRGAASARKLHDVTRLASERSEWPLAERAEALRALDAVLDAEHAAIGLIEDVLRRI